jgi:lipoprotein LpqH
LDNRLIAITGAVVLAVAGCSSQPPALGGSTAYVTINGMDAGGAHPVNCSQSGWTWFFRTPKQDKGFTASLRTDDPVAANAVQIFDLAGFSGEYWQGSVGQAKASVSGRMFTLTGQAQGYFAANPTNRTQANFVIRANC